MAIQKNYLKDYFDREKTRMIMIMMKLGSKDKLMQESAALLQSRLGDNLRENILSEYYLNSKLSFKVQLKKWTMENKEERKVEKTENVKVEVAQFFVNKVKNFKEVAFDATIKPEQHAMLQKCTVAVVKKYPDQYGKSGSSPKQSPKKSLLHSNTISSQNHSIQKAIVP